MKKGPAWPRIRSYRICINYESPIVERDAGVPYPLEYRLGMGDAFDEKGRPMLDRLKTHFAAEGRVTEEVALRIIHECSEILRREPNVLDVEAPITGSYTPYILWSSFYGASPLSIPSWIYWRSLFSLAFIIFTCAYYSHFLSLIFSLIFLSNFLMTLGFNLYFDLLFIKKWRMHYWTNMYL